MDSFESAFLWSGLRSYIFHIAAESQGSRKIRAAKTILSHPGMCYTLEELTTADAADVMEKDFRRMQSDVHRARIGKKPVNEPADLYASEVADLADSVKRGKEKIFRVKVLIDADKLDRKAAKAIVGKLVELRM